MIETVVAAGVLTITFIVGYMHGYTKAYEKGKRDGVKHTTDWMKESWKR